MERRITIEESGVYHEDYQMRMLRMNHIEGVLPVKGRGMNSVSCYDYDVSGKISLQAMFERNKMGHEDLKTLLKCFDKTVCEVQKYLLNIHCLILLPEYIFYENEQYYFCYFPQNKGEIWQHFHELTEFFVKVIDYEDKECVQMMFLLHKKTMGDNYSIKKVILESMRAGKQQEQKNESSYEIYDDGDILGDFQYDAGQHDWIFNQQEGNRIMEETDRLWLPMKRFLNRHKKNKFGNWDGLHIHEDYLDL